VVLLIYLDLSAEKSANCLSSEPLGDAITEGNAVHMPCALISIDKRLRAVGRTVK
jgi:hypothetical protein